MRFGNPISQGKPVFLMEVKGEEPVPTLWPLIVMTSAPALATPAAMMPTRRGNEFYADAERGDSTARRSWIVREVFDAVNVVVRRSAKSAACRAWRAGCARCIRSLFAGSWPPRRVRDLGILISSSSRDKIIGSDAKSVRRRPA